MKDIVRQLDQSTSRSFELEEREREWRTKEKKGKEENTQLNTTLKSIEQELEKAERGRRLMEEEIDRLHAALREKEEHIQVIKSLA